jgi:hypothetical protein
MKRLEGKSNLKNNN